jgi:hypothetical protein
MVMAYKTKTKQTAKNFCMLSALSLRVFKSKLLPQMENYLWPYISRLLLTDNMTIYDGKEV